MKKRSVHYEQSVFCTWFLFFGVGAVQKQHGLTALAVVVRDEGGRGDALGDALFGRPQYGAIEIIAGADVGKGILITAWSRTSGGAPQECDHVGADAVFMGVEAGRGDPFGDAVFCGPQNGLIVVTAGAHIGEG